MVLSLKYISPCCWCRHLAHLADGEAGFVSQSPDDDSSASKSTVEKATNVYCVLNFISL